ncbi:MAG: threonine--tRNA ligase [Candidatus Latescibacterota bacterium]|jgi:threonyl-tRNA synthetase|nr:MAG: threonine--tRNA ligase [Candidatus Latescibacterota bacterium]
MAELVLKDGSRKAIDGGEPLSGALEALSGKTRRDLVAFRIDGRLRDVRTRVPDGASEIHPVVASDDGALEVLRHSASHLMALAVQTLFPEARFGIGPSIEDGFYYDILLDRSLAPEDLVRIEEVMAGVLAGEPPPFTREEMSSAEATALFEKLGQPFKVELIRDLGAETVSVYRLGSFVDLCAGPHLPDIKMVKAFKLLSIAGAYWRGDERNQMMQRIYGTAFFSDGDLKKELARREEAKRRDHRRLGPQLELFDIKDEAGGGLVFWYPKGYLLRETIENYWKDEHRRRGYEIIMTPHIARSNLWHTSGHYDYYRENMFIIPCEDQEFVLKPMNCPGHILVYKSKLHSYRDLPVRYAELGTVYRNERTGTLHGLLRVRGFTQDDAHIFCTPEQLMDEVDGCFEFAHSLLTAFGFTDYRVELSVHDPANMAKYAGTEEEWERAEASLLAAIEKRGIPYHRMTGEAVFYGPKIDLKLIDAIGRGWQATTIQFDFNLPRRFDVQYVNAEGQRAYVYMIHRALLGSIERFIGTLTEHYAGEFPLWLAPEQVRVFPIGPGQHDYVRSVVRRLVEGGLRAHADLREEKIGYRIREAEIHKIPYMAVAGEREMAEGTLDIRSKRKGRVGVKGVDEFLAESIDEIRRKTYL